MLQRIIFGAIYAILAVCLFLFASPSITGIVFGVISVIALTEFLKATDILGNKIFYRITEDNRDQILNSKYNGINSDIIYRYNINNRSFASLIMNKDTSIISCFNHLFRYIVRKSQERNTTIQGYLESHKMPGNKEEDWCKYKSLERTEKVNSYKDKKLYVDEDNFIKRVERNIDTNEMQVFKKGIINIFKKDNSDRYSVFVISYLYDSDTNFVFGCDIDTEGNIYYDTIDVKDRNGEYITDEKGNRVKGCCYEIRFDS